MTYKVEYSRKAEKQLDKLNPSIRKIILLWIDKNLQGCTNPYARGKGLTANRNGQWRYRVGDYRLICEIQNDKLVILVLTVGDRKTVYNS